MLGSFCRTKLQATNPPLPIYNNDLIQKQGICGHNQVKVRLEWIRVFPSY